jgi:hypothetical protein
VVESLVDGLWWVSELMVLHLRPDSILPKFSGHQIRPHSQQRVPVRCGQTEQYLKRTESGFGTSLPPRSPTSGSGY